MVLFKVRCRREFRLEDLRLGWTKVIALVFGAVADVDVLELFTVGEGDSSGPEIRFDDADAVLDEA